MKNKPKRQEIDATTFLVGRELSKCTRVVGFTAVLSHLAKASPFCTCPRPRDGHCAPGTLASNPANYLALKPAKSSSRRIFLWLLWGLFCKALLLLTTTAHLSAVRQRLSHQKSAVQVLGDVPCLWQRTRCLIRCDNMLLCELYIRHCTEIAPCHAVFALVTSSPVHTW